MIVAAVLNLILTAINTLSYQESIALLSEHSSIRRTLTILMWRGIFGCVVSLFFSTIHLANVFSNFKWLKVSKVLAVVSLVLGLLSFCQNLLSNLPDALERNAVYVFIGFYQQIVGFLPSLAYIFFWNFAVTAREKKSLKNALFELGQQLEYGKITAWEYEQKKNEILSSDEYQ